MLTACERAATQQAAVLYCALLCCSATQRQDLPAHPAGQICLSAGHCGTGPSSQLLMLPWHKPLGWPQVSGGMRRHLVGTSGSLSAAADMLVGRQAVLGARQ